VADGVAEIQDTAKVAFFFKQWGGLRAKSGGRDLDGLKWNEFPDVLSSYSVAAE